MKHFYLFLSAALPLICAPVNAQPLKVICPVNSTMTLEKPVVKPATGITSTTFTANWEPVPGAEGYAVYVYTKTVAPSDGQYTIADEDFAGITSGSIITPGGGDEVYVDLSENGYALSYGWSAYAYPTFITGMVDGLVYSPYFDLRHDDGKYKITITSYANQGDTIRIDSHGSQGEEVRKYQVGVEGQGLSTDTQEFSNGCYGLFFSCINVTAALGTPDYTDRVTVTQNLHQGDEFYTNIAANEAVDAVEDGDSVASCRFSNVTQYAEGNTIVYYDIYAVAYDMSTPSGSTPYTVIYSPYSNRVKVDLKNHISQVEEDEQLPTHIVDITTAQLKDENWYDLSGRVVSNPTKGFYIHGGKKVILK